MRDLFLPATSLSFEQYPMFHVFLQSAPSHLSPHSLSPTGKGSAHAHLSTWQMAKPRLPAPPLALLDWQYGESGQQLIKRDEKKNCLSKGKPCLPISSAGTQSLFQFLHPTVERLQEYGQESDKIIGLN